MNNSLCLICLEPAFTSIDNKLLTSSQCGHKVCRRCLQFNQQRQHIGEHQEKTVFMDGTGASSIEKNRNPTNKQALMCPLCKTITPSEGWIDRGLEDSTFEQEKIIRQRVMAIYNSMRRNFETTPLYDMYLEKREQAIWELTFGEDDTLKKELEEELQQIETTNQKQIVECRQKTKALEEEEIRDIVKKEGVFYEIVQQNFGPGFRYSHMQAGSEPLVHPLQRNHPELFITEAEIALVTESFRTSSQLGVGGQPKPIQSGLTYDKIVKRQSTDKNSLYRACGMFRETLGKRIGQELWGGLGYGISIIPIR